VERHRKNARAANQPAREATKRKRDSAPAEGGAPELIALDGDTEIRVFLTIGGRRL